MTKKWNRGKFIQTIAFFIILLPSAFGATTKGAIEGYVKDLKGGPQKKVRVWIASGCNDDVNFLAIPIISRNAAALASIKFPASQSAKGQKQTTTDQNGHYRPEVNPEHSYYMAVGRGEDYAVVNVHGSETVRYDISIRGEKSPFIWCLAPPPAYRVELVNSGFAPRMLGSIEDLLPAPAIDRIVLPATAAALTAAQDDDPAAPSWRDPTTGITWTKNASRQQLKWEDAQGYCRSLSLEGYSAWRMPTIDELERLSVLSNLPGSKVRVNLRGSWSATPTGNRASDGTLGAWVFVTDFSKARRVGISIDVPSNTFCVHN